MQDTGKNVKSLRAANNKNLHNFHLFLFYFLFLNVLIFFNFETNANPFLFVSI